MTEKSLAIYRASYKVFNGLFYEMRELSKKRPEATLSKGKVKILNRVLSDIKSIFKGEPEEKYLDLLDDETLPQNSDAVLVMVQYDRALDAFRDRYRNKM